MICFTRIQSQLLGSSEGYEPSNGHKPTATWAICTGSILTILVVSLEYELLIDVSQGEDQNYCSSVRTINHVASQLNWKDDSRRLTAHSNRDNQCQGSIIGTTSSSHFLRFDLFYANDRLNLSAGMPSEIKGI